jgi:hypothetical protein
MECVFELKTEGVGITALRIQDRIRKHLSKAGNQLEEYLKDEAKYGCSLVALSVWAELPKHECILTARNRYKDTLCNSRLESLLPRL